MTATDGKIAPTAMTVFGVTMDASGNTAGEGIWVDMFKQYPSSSLIFTMKGKKAAILSRVVLRRKIRDSQEEQGVYNMIPNAN